MKLLISLGLLANLANAQNYDIRQVAATNNVEEAIAARPAKKTISIERYKQVELDNFPAFDNNNKGLGAIAGALARLVTDFEVEKVNEFLLDERFQPGPVGTRMNIARVCKRDGDYDFALMELIRVAYLGGHKLSQKAYNRLLYTLLNQKGNKHHTHFTICPWKTKMKDTENHILMSETARYLTNQLMYERTGEMIYDNEANGFNDWLMEHLRYFFTHGFSEINSKPYGGYTVSALLNLHDFSWNPQIKAAVRALLDYSTMKFAMESSGGRRFPTYRRQVKHYHKPRVDQHDTLAIMMHYWVGNYQYLFDDDIDLSNSMVPYGPNYMFRASLSAYTPHPAVLETIFELQEGHQYNQLDHGAKQIAYRTADYVLSAGGVHRRVWPKVTLVNDVLAMPTILIPKKTGSMRNQFFQFKGNNKSYRKSNLCVAKNFMCGLNIKEPTVAQECYETHGHWKFYDFTKEGCTDDPHEGLYIATYKKRLRHWLLRKIKAKTFGLLEVKKADGDFASFKENILEKNSRGFNRSKDQVYISSDDRQINFDMDPRKGELNVAGVSHGEGGRIKGTHHQMDQTTMRMKSPRGYTVEYNWGDLDYKIVNSN